MAVVIILFKAQLDHLFEIFLKFIQFACFDEPLMYGGYHAAVLAKICAS